MKKGTKHLLQLVVAASLFTGAAKLATADTFVFDADGAGARVPARDTNAFHLGSGDSLARAVLPFSVGATFQLLFHGQQSFVASTSGDGFLFEITVVGSVTERITAANEGPPSRITFQLAKNQTSESFIEIYADSEENPGPNANNLEGTGFNDGVLILRGSLVSTLPNVGTFCLTDPQPSPAPSLDLFGTNDYPGVATVVGTGGTKLNVVVGYLDRRFFPAPPEGATGRQVQIGDIVTVDISHATPFNGVDPSRLFTGSPNPGTGAAPSPTVAPNVGTVNGSSGPDLETESTIVFSIAPSPTPSGTPGTTPIPGIPKVVVSVSRTQMREGADSTITFSVNQPHSDLTVFYQVGGSATLGVDYTLTDMNGAAVIPGVQPILSTQNSVSIVLHSISDTIREPNGEPAKLSLLPGVGYQVAPNNNANRAVVLILDRNG